MIGQYGKYNFDKFNRDYRKGFYGTEACLLNSEEDIDNLAAESRKNGFNIGIHFPLRAGVHKLRDPQFLSNIDSVREDSFRYIKEELNYIKQKKINPKHIVFHYPKPVILDGKNNWKNWRFADSSEYIYEPEYSYDEFVTRSEYLFEWLSEKSFEYSFVPVLELDAICKFIYNTNILEELLDRFEKIKLCIDTGRLHTQDKTESLFDPFDIIRRFSKYAVEIHLSNTKITDCVEYHHYPVLPGLRPNEGWADIESYLRIIHQNNPNVKVMFEHRSDLISDEELETCYSWVDGLLQGE
jgi:sugar phosphate isomerase/epimerase